MQQRCAGVRGAQVAHPVASVTVIEAVAPEQPGASMAYPKPRFRGSPL